jgi:DNA-binding SARP family transcriptional activator
MSADHFLRLTRTRGVMADRPIGIETMTFIGKYDCVISFRILGPLEIRDGADKLWVPTRRKIRALLTLLLLRNGTPISPDLVVEVLWGEDPPPSARANVQSYVSELRRLFGSADPNEAGESRLETVDGGYQLRVEPDELDATVFARLAGSGRQAFEHGDLPLAAQLLPRALGLWRGAVAQGLSLSERLQPYATRLDELRLATLEDYLEVRLTLGEAGSVVDELRLATAANPYRERLRGQLMLALYRAGRVSEAHHAYQDMYRLLDAELDITPGAELTELYEKIAHDDESLRPAKPEPARSEPARSEPVPQQLPADVVGFTGRAEQLQRLRELVRGAAAGIGASVVVVSGSAGVGKTALAVHCAHRLARDFPDGRLYLNLRGFAAEQPLSPAEGLGALLRALGEPPQMVPVDVEEAAALFRSRVAGTRTLVVLDNVRDATQVRPLLPAGPGCVTLVTSRERLDGLVARDGAVQLVVPPMPESEALELVRGVLGEVRVRDERAAVERLARLCAYLPLALRIATTKLAHAEELSIADYTTELCGSDALAQLAIDGDPQAAVEVAFDQSYQRLGEFERRLFRLHGLAPLHDAGVPAVAVLLGADRREARRALDRLRAAYLIDTVRPGRYGQHDLLRTFARDRARVDEPDGGAAALGNLARWYLHQAQAAATLLYGHMLRLPPAPDDQDRPVIEFADHIGAVTWLEAERANLVALIEHTGTRGPVEVAWRLADALRGYLASGLYLAEWQRTAEPAQAAAERFGDGPARTAMAFNRASVAQIAGRLDEAIDGYTRAASLAEECGWLAAAAGVEANLGMLRQVTADVTGAIANLARARDLYHRIGDRRGEGNVLTNLGSLHGQKGNLADAVGYLTEALEMGEAQPSVVGSILTNLGALSYLTGRYDEALRQLTDGLSSHREFGNRYDEIGTLAQLAELHRCVGRYDRALADVTAALTLADEVGVPLLSAYAMSVKATVDQSLTGPGPEPVGKHQRAVEFAVACGVPFVEAETLTGLAEAEFDAGWIDNAQQSARRVLELTYRYGFQHVAGRAMVVTAAVHAAQGRLAEAAELAGAAAAAQRRTGFRKGEGEALLVLGRARWLAGDRAAAQQSWQESFALFTGIGAEPDAARVRAEMSTASGSPGCR